ncbi:hypothetical protein ElyMa_004136200 [Elysia marginata]|uniref:CTNNB1 binding N-teminal domain-containing protein n=1 Tax=Elysia marginata TaxID=1093978 RepID=A0AAV4GEG0_9GAST|nr:hypothetical protein ElyMa_004136200 [Elysia marginata]
MEGDQVPPQSTGEKNSSLYPVFETREAGMKADQDSKDFCPSDATDGNNTDNFEQSTEKVNEEFKVKQTGCVA